MNDIIKQEAIQEFEKATIDWGLDYDLSADGLSYINFSTGIAFGSFLLGYEACYIKYAEVMSVVPGEVMQCHDCPSAYNLDSCALPFTEHDENFLWCTQNLSKLAPFKGGMVAVKLPHGIVAGGHTVQEFEMAMKNLSGDELKNLYVISTDVFL